MLVFVFAVHAVHASTVELTFSISHTLSLSPNNNKKPGLTGVLVLVSAASGVILGLYAQHIE